MNFEEELLNRFHVFFNNVDLSSTYKPVFLKSIMDLSDFGKPGVVGSQWVEKVGNQLKVDLNFVVIRYAKYYWDMYYKFNLRQSHTPQDVNIHKFFGDKQDPHKPPTLTDLAEEKYETLRKEMISKSIKPQVLKRLNNDLCLYQIINGKNYILFDHNIIEFLKKYKGILIPAINFITTRYLEKINSSPRIAEKVLGKIPRSFLKPDEKKIIMKYHDSCFYCGKIEQDYAFDHVIPFDYIYQTDLFNMVPACTSCNGSKSNRLSTREFFNKVLERNKKIKELKDYSASWYENLYDKCKLEYHKGSFFSV